MDMKYIPIALCGLLVAACGSDTDDLNAWMAQEASTMSGRVAPIPEIKPHAVVEYEVAGEMDPFDVARIAPETRADDGPGGDGPDMTRQPEPLETFPLSSLAMVGMLRQEGEVRALVRAGTSLYQVKVGNYMGQDHGEVMEIDDTQVVLSEWVQNSEGGWSKRTNTLILQEH